MNSKIPIDLGRMTKAFEEAINRHGSFRTTFHWDEKGKLVQMIHPSVYAHNTSVVDLSNEPNLYKVAYNMSLAYKPVPKVDQLYPPTRAHNSLIWLAGLPCGLGNALSYLYTFLKSKVTKRGWSCRQWETHNLETTKDDEKRGAQLKSQHILTRFLHHDHTRSPRCLRVIPHGWLILVRDRREAIAEFRRVCPRQSEFTPKWRRRCENRNGMLRVCNDLPGWGDDGQVF